MSSTSAVDLKARAAAAWERGDFTAAAELYSEAIANVPVDSTSARLSAETKELLRVLYSNRSAAYLK
jgi:alkyl sulfatase BDS1-like metallo-beta-lactamase superfamily hydrolase